MPFEPRPLTVETLVDLLNEGTERPGLDYKATCDLNVTRDKVAIIKDIAAMQLRGGYIVVGADSNGRPTEELTAAAARLFDQAGVQDKARRYLAEGFRVRSTYLELNGSPFAVMCVEPHPQFLAPMTADGNWTDQETGETGTEFRTGDILARDGSQSRRCTAEHIRQVIEDIRREQHEIARAEFRADLAALRAEITETNAIATGQATALDWSLTVDALRGAVIEQIRVGDMIPVTLLLRGARRQAERVMQEARDDDLDLLLDHLVCLIATFLTIDRPELAGTVIGVLGTIYDASFDDRGFPLARLGQISSADLMLRIITRIWAVGGLAVRQRHWMSIRELALYRPAAYGADHYENWLHHGAVMAARADLIGARNNLSVLVVAQDHVRRLDPLRPDLEPEDEAIMTSLCQFDLYACLATIGADQGRFFAQFARWYAHRSDPAAVAVIEKDDVRAQIFPHDSRALADGLRTVAENAHQMAGMISGWDGYEDPRILAFLERHLA